MADTGAPTLEKLALKSTGPAAAGTVGTAPADGDQLVSAFRFGWSLEELVWRLNSWQAPKTAGPDDDFPPDLTHERSSAEHVRELATLLKSDGKQLVGSNPEPATSATTLARIHDLLTAYESNSDTTQFLTGAQRIGATIRLWDADIVDAIIDQDPTIITAYELGKALSLTQWRILGATTTTPAGAAGDPQADAWQSEFSRDRITTIRRHLETLAPTLDGRKISAVSASLSFWSRAYERGRLADTGSTSSQQQAAQPRIPSNSDKRADLVDALGVQLANWYDLLTDRRDLDSFPVTAVVSDLVGKYASSQMPRWQGALVRVAVIVVAILVMAVVVAVLLAAVSAATAAQPAVSGVAGGITALTAFLAARGVGLLDRGASTVEGLQARVSELGNQVSGAVSASATTGVPPLTFGGLATEVFANVVDQIRLEESKIAISQPLVDYIMGRDLSDPPEKVIRDFLSKVLETDETSNLDRLTNVFQGLCNSYRA